MIDLKKYGYPRKRDENEPDALVGPLPPVDAKPVAWMRDLDGTGSLHPASQGDPGSFPVYPAAAIIALQGERDTVANAWLNDRRDWGAKIEAAEAEVARLKAELAEAHRFIDIAFEYEGDVFGVHHNDAVDFLCRNSLKPDGQKTGEKG